MNDCPHTSTISIDVNLPLQHEDTVMTFLRMPATKCDRCGTVTHLPVITQELHQRPQAHAEGGKRVTEWWRGPWQQPLLRSSDTSEKLRIWKAPSPRKLRAIHARGRNRRLHRVRPYGHAVGVTHRRLDTLNAAYLNARGPVAPGNKPLGHSNLYAGLVQAFSVLKKRGITLPRNRRPRIRRDGTMRNNIQTVSPHPTTPLAPSRKP